MPLQSSDRRFATLWRPLFFVALLCACGGDGDGPGETDEPDAVDAEVSETTDGDTIDAEPDADIEDAEPDTEADAHAEPDGESDVVDTEDEADSAEDTDAGTDPDVRPPQDVAEDVVPPPLSEATIGLRGGTILLPGGGRAIIPAGAVDTPTDFRVVRAEGDFDVPGGEELGDAWEFSPDGLVLAEPMTLMLPLPDGTTPTAPVVALSDDGGASWEVVPARVAPLAGMLIAEIPHFSIGVSVDLFDCSTITCASDGNPCTEDSCDPLAGGCWGPVVEGTSCGNECDPDAVCNATGTCQEAPIPCDDGNPCTVDACVPGSGCVNSTQFLDEFSSGLAGPSDIEWGEDGLLYVALPTLASVDIYDADGTLIDALINQIRPRALTFLNDGDLIAAGSRLGVLGPQLVRYDAADSYSSGTEFDVDNAWEHIEPDFYRPSRVDALRASDNRLFLGVSTIVDPLSLSESLRAGAVISISLDDLTGDDSDEDDDEDTPSLFVRHAVRQLPSAIELYGDSNLLLTSQEEDPGDFRPYDYPPTGIDRFEWTSQSSTATYPSERRDWFRDLDWGPASGMLWATHIEGADRFEAEFPNLVRRDAGADVLVAPRTPGTIAVSGTFDADGYFYQAVGDQILRYVGESNYPLLESPCLNAVWCDEDGELHSNTVDDGTPCTDELGTDGTCEMGVCVTACTGETCNDGNPCTGPDMCVDGECMAGPRVTCFAEGPCLTGECIDFFGCSVSSAVDGTPCDDGDACTLGEHCQLGECEARFDRPCFDDGNPCTTQYCDPVAGCVTEPVRNGVACPGGTCTAGECDIAGGPHLCVANGENIVCFDDAAALVATYDAPAAGECLAGCDGVCPGPPGEECGDIGPGPLSVSGITGLTEVGDGIFAVANGLCHPLRIDRVTGEYANFPTCYSVAQSNVFRLGTVNGMLGLAANAGSWVHLYDPDDHPLPSGSGPILWDYPGVLDIEQDETGTIYLLTGSSLFRVTEEPDGSYSTSEVADFTGHASGLIPTGSLVLHAGTAFVPVSAGSPDDEGVWAIGLGSGDFVHVGDFGNWHTAVAVDPAGSWLYIGVRGDTEVIHRVPLPAFAPAETWLVDGPLLEVGEMIWTSVPAP